MAFKIYNFNYKYFNGDATYGRYILTEVADDSTQTLSVKQPHHHSDIVMLYIDYQKGSENGLILDYKTEINTGDDNVPSKQYAVSYLNTNSDVVTRQMNVTETGVYRIPVSVVPTEDNLIINFTFDGSGPYGDVETYVIPQ
jgi:hypothetical protein